MLGADWALGRATGGLAVSHSRGAGGYRALSGDGPAGDGEVSSTLTGLYSYGRYAVLERLSLWGVAGYGVGTLTLTLTPAGMAAIETDLGLAMAAVGGRGVLAKPPAAWRRCSGRRPHGCSMPPLTAGRSCAGTVWRPGSATGSRCSATGSSRRRSSAWGSRRRAGSTARAGVSRWRAPEHGAGLRLTARW